MRMAMLYLFALLFVTYTSIPANTLIEPAFEPYLRLFPTSINEIVGQSHLVVKLGTIRDKEVVGFCAKESNLLGVITRRLIIIDKTHWNRLSYKSRQLLLFHEFGHCLFNKGHDERLRFDGCPRSIMFPTILPEYCIERHYEDYLLQLL